MVHVLYLYQYTLPLTFVKLFKCSSPVYIIMVGLQLEQHCIEMNKFKNV
jgi:hypothetical protein